ncbi:NAD(P)-dependent alcohol dehydrogenase [Bauldia litoralis]|uniref:NADPH:quinone reductase n=1 Tax=Bauldia litoralis TaxID=665467 RepID=A0A1G6CPD9_9HYPH|nr:NAD(P)-dependent alcohol dehydrogenase [Bauldia litoralis]SDB34756.1 NADPH:quinone reductase [Bauldia litoralis]
MKAAVFEKYGSADVIAVKDVPRPEIADNQILVKVFATTVTTADWRIRASAFPGIMWLPGRLMMGLFAPKKKILGVEFSGRVVSVGDKVTRFRMGDAVFGFSGDGAHAEYVAIAEDGPVVPKPEAVGYDEAASIPFGAVSALVFLRDFARIQPGHKVLVAGASGGVGGYAVQLARHFGAEVTAVTSTANVDLVRSLGADHVVDYTQADYTRGGETYDIVIDTAGTTTFAAAKRVLAKTGVFVPLEFGAREIRQALVSRMTGGPKVVIGVSGDSREDLAFLAPLMESGELRSVIDSRYPLGRIADAHRRVESRHKTGAVVVTVAPASVPAAVESGIRAA